MEGLEFWLSLAGNITSIIGFFMTIAVFFGIKSLKTYYVAKGTIPNEMDRLTRIREEIELLFNGKFNDASREKVIDLSSSAKVIITNLMPKLKEMNKDQYSKQIQPNVNDYLKSHSIFIGSQTRDNARVLNRSLYAFLHSAELVINDDNWRRSQ